MACEHVSLPGGGSAIVCGRRSRKAKCCSCGKPAGLLCDWKVKEKRSGTCDEPICANCTSKPAQGKDLCPQHAAEWAARSAATKGADHARP